MDLEWIGQNKQVKQLVALHLDLEMVLLVRVLMLVVLDKQNQERSLYQKHNKTQENNLKQWLLGQVMIGYHHFDMEHTALDGGPLVEPCLRILL